MYDNNDTIRLNEIRKEMVYAQKPTEIRVPFARTTNSEWVELVINDTPSHVLITGQTGYGKSSLLHTIIFKILCQYTFMDVSFWLFDSHSGHEYMEYATFRSVGKVYKDRTSEGVLQFLRELQAEHEKRLYGFQKANAYNYQTYCKSNYGKDNPLQRLFVVVDGFEVFNLYSTEQRIILSRIIRESWATGICLILSGQCCPQFPRELEMIRTRISMKQSKESAIETLQDRCIPDDMINMICNTQGNWSQNLGKMVCKNVLVQSEQQLEYVDTCLCTLDYHSQIERVDVLSDRIFWI